LWFHSVIWPAVLMSLDLPLPKCVFAHSFWISEGKKMSKSMGNFIDLELIDSYVDKYSMDAWRYYIVTQGPLGSSDADFVAENFQDLYNAHLVNTVGNCTSRVTAMLGKYFDGVVQTESQNGKRITFDGFDWPTTCESAIGAWSLHMEAFALDKAIESAMCLIREVDLFINETAPFKLAKDETKTAELGAILYQCLEVLRIASILLDPVIPSKMNEFRTAISAQTINDTFSETIAWGGIKNGSTVEKVALFPRVS
ncbi:MAG: class I tRNA ligase family protein, partial [Phycisphaerae bacterium]|nr:class I tRNA ligase family protein [Phycisphaerae bacterium]